MTIKQIKKLYQHLTELNGARVVSEKEYKSIFKQIRKKEDCAKKGILF